MSDEKRIATYKGRPCTELTRDELVEAYTKACENLDLLRRCALEDAKMERELREASAILARQRGAVTP